METLLFWTEGSRILDTRRCTGSWEDTPQSLNKNLYTVILLIMADVTQIIAQCSAVFQENLDNTYGALYIGFVSCVLYISFFCLFKRSLREVSGSLLGTTNLQVYIYFQRYDQDMLWYKINVSI